MVLGSINARKEELRCIAERQYGYFTAKQAVSAGYIKTVHQYHVEHGNWLKVETALFRLPGYPNSMRSDFAKWSLWSRNQQEQPQGIISHESALAFHGFDEFDPGKIHLTVPVRFRKKIPDKIIIHKASLSLSSIESHGCFMVTRLPRTLADMREQLQYEGRWNGLLEKAVADGRLSQDEASAFGFSDRVPMPRANMRVNCEENYESLADGVWKMIFSRSESTRRRSQAGFTVVELLVVIALISTLSALLVPVLEKARVSAKKMECINNSKQAMMAVASYISDFRGKMILVYSDKEMSSWGAHLFAGGYLDQDNAGVFHCSESNYGIGIVATFANYYTYSCNYNGKYRNTASKAVYSWTKKRYDKLFDAGKAPPPAEYVFFLDGKKSGAPCNINAFELGSISGGRTWSGTPWTIHDKDKRVVCAFLDAHVGAETCDRIKELTRPQMEFVYDPLASW